MGRKRTKSSSGLSAIHEPHLLNYLMSSLPDAVYFKDREGRYTRMNRAMAEILGLSGPEEAIGRTAADFFPADHVERARREETSILESGKPLVDAVRQITWPDGRVQWFLTTKMQLRDASGRVIGTFGISRNITEQKRAEARLRDSEALYQSLVENLPQNIFRKSPEGVFTFANQKFCDTIGKPLDQILGLTDADLFPEALAAKYRADDEHVIRTGRSLELTEDHHPPGKARLVVRVVKTPIRDAEGRIVGVQGIFWDVTELTIAQESLRESEERYALALEGAHDGIWDWDLTQNQVHFTPRWKAQVGHAEDEIGTSPDEWMRRIHPEDLERVRAELADHLEGRTDHFQSEHRVRHKDRGYRWMLARGVAVRDDGGRPTRIAGSQADVTDRKRAEEVLAHQAFYDDLTGLPNRALFLDRLGHAIRRYRRSTTGLFAVLFIDVDRFKDVNDSLGHGVGDALLRAIARRLEVLLRPGDTVARMGGDEFAILLDELRDPDDTVQIVERVLRDLTRPFSIRTSEVFASASIGIVPGSAYEKPEDMLRDADIAMYRAKERGRNCYEIFDQEMHARAVARLNLETDLRRALERGELKVFYQPIVSLSTDRIAGFEALVRWMHPERGLVSPNEFIPLAEETGLVIELDHWVMREACRQVRDWQNRLGFSPPLTLNVNLSSRHFSQPGLVTRVLETLRETSFDPGQLRLEITESAIMEESSSLAAVLRDLKELRLQLYLDDFGTGYSSLAYLHRFPIDSLKIHHSFVKQLENGNSRGKLVQTITTLAANLKMGVVAEGVETEEQLALLRELRCERVQGFYFSRPVDAATAEALLARRPVWNAGRARTA